MAESPTWRDLLAEIIKDPQEKERIAAALGVNPLTLRRWARSEANPRSHLLQRLFAVVPQLRPLLADESNAFATPSADESTSHIPVTFYSHILDLHSNTPDEQRFWSICTAVLQEALKQLPRKGIGLDISVVRCLAPPQGNIIRCLREYVGLGAFSWREQVELRQRLFGAESLAGYVVASGHSTVIANLNQEQRLPHQLPDSALSAAAFPILHASRIAGCLLVGSTEPDYFHVPALHDLLQSYAALLTLAFQPKDFYELPFIQLGVIPSFQVQQSYLSTFRERIIPVLRKAADDHHPMSYPQAEQHVWWQIAEELLQLPASLSAET